jgi:hypothetical protein
MAEWQIGGMAEWQNGRMAEWYFTTYLIYPAIFMVHTNDADEDTNNNAIDTDNTNGFQII